MNISLLNLSRETTAEELEELFKVHGVVESCDIIMNKNSDRSKGFGFIKMPNNSEASAAIKSLNGKQVGTNKIKVKVLNKAK